jgi:hypothetical protein
MPRLLLLVLIVIAVAVAGCGSSDDDAAPAGNDSLISDAGPQHVNGLGINPGDGDLYIATHSGLWRAPEGEAKATRVGALHHDLMGFTIAGDNRFLSSGHPDAREDLPPQIGLQRSDDGGESWDTVSPARRGQPAHAARRRAAHLQRGLRHRRVSDQRQQWQVLG